MSNNALRDAQRSVAEAIRIGGRQNAVAHPGASGAVFSQALWEQAIGELGMFERLLVKASWDLSARALRAARAGQCATSQQYFSEARTTLSGQGTPVRVALLCQSFYEAAHAYLDYRLGDEREACSRLVRAMEIDVELERAHGVTILYLHRVQLLHNRMRVDMRSGRVEVAVDLGARMVGHLQGFAPTMLELPPPCGDVLGDAPRATVEAMILQVAGDVAVALTGADADDGVAHIDSVQSMVGVGVAPLMVRVHLWACAKMAFLTRKQRDFVEYAERMLRDGRGEVGLLWDAVLVDVLAWCRNEPEAGESLRAALEELKVRPPAHPRLAEYAQHLARNASRV